MEWLGWNDAKIGKRRFEWVWDGDGDGDSDGRGLLLLELKRSVFVRGVGG